MPSSTRRAALTPTIPSETKFKAGMRVRNTAWGDGVVLEARIENDGEETVDIHFASVGFKRLIASLAQLEIGT